MNIQTKPLSPARQRVLDFYTQAFRDTGSSPSVMDASISLRIAGTVIYDHLKYLVEAGLLTKQERVTTYIPCEPKAVEG